MAKILICLCAIAVVGSFTLLKTAYGDSVTIQPGGAEGKDAHIVSGIPDINLGDYDYLTQNWSKDDDNGLIEFDLDSLAGATITSATLSLYHGINYNAGGASVGLYRILEYWEEMGVTWDTSPDYQPEPVSVLVIPDDSVEVWRDWDVTGIVRDWVAGNYENHGLRIGRTEQNNSYIYLFSSDYGDAAFHPKLHIEYQTAAPVPTVSEWGMIILALLFLAAATVLIRRRNPSP